MKKIPKLLMGLQIAILMTAVAFPVQAAVNIGAPQTLSGSVVSLRSYVPGTVPVTPISTATPTQATQTTVTTPTTTYIQTSAPTQFRVNIGPLPSTLSGSVVSLKGILSQPTTPVTTTPTSTPTPTPTPTPSTNPTVPAIPAVSALTADEQHMVDMINQERIAAGVNPVKVDLRLAAVGRAKAIDMNVNNYFSHTSPTYGSPWAMMQQVGLTVGWAGENIGRTQSVESAMAGFMTSPGHRANILDPRFTHVGIGIAGNLYVQEFLQE